MKLGKKDIVVGIQFEQELCWLGLHNMRGPCTTWYQSFLVLEHPPAVRLYVSSAVPSYAEG